MDLLGWFDWVVLVYRNVVYFIFILSIIYMFGSIYINDKNSDCWLKCCCIFKDV